MLAENRLLGHYRLVRRIGEGGMGEVYLAGDTRISRQVAIKVIRAEIEPYPDPVKMQDKVRLFQREMRVITMLDHPHILPLFDFGEEKDGNMVLTYMVMPYRQEGSLVDWLQQRGKGERLMPSEVSYFVTQAADALQHAHDRNLIHQDVKPSNFLVHNRSGDMLPDLLLMDFGTARMTTATVTASQSIRGTPAFMAPEQWEGRPQPATDQYALAVMAHLLLTGDTLFSGRMEQVMHQHLTAQPQPPGSLNPAVSPELDAVILRALEKEPAARFPSILAFAQAFQQALQFAPRQGPIVLAPKKAEATVSSDAAEPKENPPSVLASLPPTQYPTKPGELPPTVEVPNPVLSAQAPTVSLPDPTPSTQAPQVAASNPGHSAQAPHVAGINIPRPNWRMPKLPPQAPGARKKVSGAKKRRLSPQVLIALAILVIISSIIPIVLYLNDWNLANVFSPYPSYLSGGHGSLTFSDPLSQEGKWSSNGAKCQFIGGGYQVEQQQSEKVQHCDASGNFSNFAFEVQLTIMQGDCGGMIFRNDGNNDYYYYSICQNGRYKISVNAGNSQSDLLQENPSSAIHSGLGQQNKIAVVASGQTMTFYANEQQIVAVVNSTYSSGSIGLAADTSSGSNTTDVMYTNARVWTL